MNNYSKVYLIGAGPGDPGLFTLKGKSILECADIVLYDRLVSPSILAFCNKNAKMVDVGKMPTHHKVKQSEINKILVKFAQENPNTTIARLKGGDPFVFGRGGEEALELVKAGVEFEVVPGITSAISVPAYAGIPVSHRGIATSFHIITGHEKEDALALSSEKTNAQTNKHENYPNSASISGLDFTTLAKCPGTLIFLMGISNMGLIARRLVECGKDPKTPLAFIEKGTTPYQRTVTCTLESAEETIICNNVTAPAITIIGNVVELGKTIAWKQKLPLSGKRLVVTRAAKQASEISAKLMALGAEVIETPMIETRNIIPQLSSPKNIPVNLSDIHQFNVLAFTSVNGVESFFETFFKAGFDIRDLAGKRIASVGKITEKKLKEYGILCDFIPDDHTGEGLGKLLASYCNHPNKNITNKENLNSIQESKILILQGNLADKTLESLLPHATRWIVYETIPTTNIPHWKREAITIADSIIFACSSAVENFANSFIKRANIEDKKIDLNTNTSQNTYNLTPHTCFSIGRLTTATARKYGFDVIESDETTMDSLVKKIVEYYA